MDLDDFKRKYRRFRYLHTSKFKWILSSVKILISGIVTICTLLTTVLSLYVAKQSFDISQKSLEVSEKSLKISKQATEISHMALRTSSLNTEPIFEVNVDYKTDKLSIKHETHEMYKIKYISFGKVRTIAIMKQDSSAISGIEVEEKYGEMPLIEGRSENVGGYSEEEARKYNKEIEISLDIDYMNEKTTLIDRLEKKIKKECNKNIHYWGVSPDFNYYYVEVVYSDAHGNLDSVYYVYKKEYMTKWKTYKITREKYKRYIKNVMSEYYGKEKENEKIIKKIFSDKNFKKFEDSKYDEYWDWFNLRQFE